MAEIFGLGSWEYRRVKAASAVVCDVGDGAGRVANLFGAVRGDWVLEIAEACGDAGGDGIWRIVGAGDGIRVHLSGDARQHAAFGDGVDCVWRGGGAARVGCGGELGGKAEARVE